MTLGDPNYLDTPPMTRPGDNFRARDGSPNLQGDPNTEQNQKMSLINITTFDSGAGKYGRKVHDPGEDTTTTETFDPKTNLTATNTVRKGVDPLAFLKESAEKLVGGGDQQPSGEEGMGLLQALSRLDFSPMQRMIDWGYGTDLAPPGAPHTPMENIRQVEEMRERMANRAPGGIKMAQKELMKRQLQEKLARTDAETQLTALKMKTAELRNKKLQAGIDNPKKTPQERFYEQREANLKTQIAKEKRIAKVKADDLVRDKALIVKSQSVPTYGYESPDYKLPVKVGTQVKQLPALAFSMVDKLDRMAALLDEHGDLSSMTSNGDKGVYMAIHSNLMLDIAKVRGFGALQKAEFAFLDRLLGPKPDGALAYLNKYFAGVETRKGQWKELRRNTIAEMTREMEVWDYKITDQAKWDSRFAVKETAKKKEDPGDIVPAGSAKDYLRQIGLGGK